MLPKNSTFFLNPLAKKHSRWAGIRCPFRAKTPLTAVRIGDEEVLAQQNFVT